MTNLQLLTDFWNDNEDLNDVPLFAEHPGQNESTPFVVIEVGDTTFDWFSDGTRVDKWNPKLHLFMSGLANAEAFAETIETELGNVVNWATMGVLQCLQVGYAAQVTPMEGNVWQITLSYNIMVEKEPS